MLFFNCLLSFGSYFSYDIPSVLQAQFQGVSKRKQQPVETQKWLWVWVTIFYLTESDMSQCNSHQWEWGLCVRTGDESSAVQLSLCNRFLDVRTCTPTHANYFYSLLMLLMAFCIIAQPLSAFFLSSSFSALSSSLTLNFMGPARGFCLLQRYFLIAAVASVLAVGGNNRLKRVI